MKVFSERPFGAKKTPYFPSIFPKDALEIREITYKIDHSKLQLLKTRLRPQPFLSSPVGQNLITNQVQTVFFGILRRFWTFLHFSG